MWVAGSSVRGTLHRRRMPKYPLKPLLEHRERTARDATEELGKAVRGRETAEAERQRAEGRRKDAEARTEAVRRGEAESLGRGELRAIDLARAEAWEVSARAQLGELARSEAAATQRASEAHA